MSTHNIRSLGCHCVISLFWVHGEPAYHGQNKAKTIHLIARRKQELVSILGIIQFPQNGKLVTTS